MEVAMKNQLSQAVAVGLALTIFFLTAIIRGRTEKFLFGDKELSLGPPDFLRLFTKGYHLPMFLEVLILALGLDTLLAGLAGHAPGIVFLIPTWAFVEDISYWIKNPFDTLDAKDWITGGFGGFRIFGQFVPYLYLVLFTYTIAIVVWLL
jgi:hypothetical protein